MSTDQVIFGSIGLVLLAFILTCGGIMEHAMGIDAGPVDAGPAAAYLGAWARIGAITETCSDGATPNSEVQGIVQFVADGDGFATQGTLIACVERFDLDAAGALLRPGQICDDSGADGHGGEWSDRVAYMSNVITMNKDGSLRQDIVGRELYSNAQVGVICDLVGTVLYHRQF
jgi:hypothetical protein